MEPNQAQDRPQGTIARITNFFTGNTTKTSKTLLKWKQSGEREEWAIKAVDALVKKLKKQTNGIHNITEVLKSRSEKSMCVTIPRSIDGRLQVSNQKSMPHVIYCRVWRWPDLQSNYELRAVKSCEFAYNKKKRDVCINPYHYDRVEDQRVLPPILVPRQSEYAPGYSMLPTQQSPAQKTHYPNTNYANNGFGPINGFNSQCSSGQTSPMSSISSVSAGYHHFQYPAVNTTQPSSHWQGNNFTQQRSELEQVHYKEPEYWANVAYYELNSRVGELFRCNTESSHSLVIDGFTNPSCATSNRFCLGQLSNVNRNSTIENTRRHIGKGVQIFFEGNELYIRCLSEAPIFVHSLMANHLYGMQTGHVQKLERDHYLKIFDTNEFATQLRQVVNMGFEASYALTRMCTIRVSFVKGWSGQYHRQDITACPCWFEIHLNGPLKWLDEVLNTMGSPLYGTSSVS